MFLSAGLLARTSLVAGSLVGVADFNRDGNPDYLLYNPSTQPQRYGT